MTQHENNQQRKPAPTQEDLRSPNRLIRSARIWMIALVLLTTPIVFRSAGVALSTRNNDVRQWLPGGFEETTQYDWFLTHFGSEEFAIVSWEGATLSDGRVSEYASRLRQYSPAASDAADRAWFAEVLTADEVLTRLTRGKTGLSREDAAARLQGSLLGPDGQTTGVVVRLSESGRADRHGAVEILRSQADGVGVPESALRLGGPTIDSVALDEQSEQSRYLLTAISLLLSSLAAWRCLRSLRLVTLVLLTSIYCGAATLAWVAFFGDELSMIMVTMPTLVFVLTVSGAIHVTHYFRMNLDSDDRVAAMRRAFVASRLPCTLTAVTTAIGLGSLMLSHVVPVRLFGFYSAIGVLTSLPVVLLFLPAVLSFLPLSSHSRRHRTAGPVTAAPALDRLSARVMRHHAPITVAGVTLMLVTLFGLTRLNTSVRIVDFFSPRSRVVADYRWLEQNLGALVPVEIVLQFPGSAEGPMNPRVDLVRRVEAALLQVPGVQSITSAATYVPELSGDGWNRMTRRAILERRLRNSRPQLQEAGYLATSESAELWRISARVAALDDIDYGELIGRLSDTITPLLSAEQELRAETEQEIDAVLTGIVPLVYKSQRVLLEDLTKSFLSAFALIGVVMLFLMRGARRGLVSMIPNTFPAIVVFGLMGWSGRKCDIGSMITASVAMGIAVDDTIHFMNWFRKGLAAGMDRRAAIQHAYRHSASAMLQTTIICGLGMLAFAFSTFGPTSGFAILMMTLLATALCGDLLFLPALLAGPVGRVFERRHVKRERTQPRPSPRSLVPLSPGPA